MVRISNTGSFRASSIAETEAAERPPAPSSSSSSPAVSSCSSPSAASSSCSSSSSTSSLTALSSSISSARSSSKSSRSFLSSSSATFSKSSSGEASSSSSAIASTSSPYIISKSIISRSCMVPLSRSSRHPAIALIVIGLSQSPSIITVLPASIRLAIAISPSRDNSSTVPISFRYIRTGSSLRPISFSSKLPLSSSSSSSSTTSGSKLSTSDSAISVIPISEIPVIISSIFSEDSLSGGNARFSSSTVI